MRTAKSFSSVSLAGRVPGWYTLPPSTYTKLGRWAKEYSPAARPPVPSSVTVVALPLPLKSVTRCQVPSSFRYHWVIVSDLPARPCSPAFLMPSKLASSHRVPEMVV